VGRRRHFFDNAEIYARGGAEKIMGEALKELGWPRQKFVVSTKFYWASRRPEREDTLNAKYLRHAIEGSLARLGLDYVDWCSATAPTRHADRGEVWAMHRMIERGRRCTGAPASGAPTRSAPPG